VLYEDPSVQAGSRRNDQNLQKGRKQNNSNSKQHDQERRSCATPGEAATVKSPIALQPTEVSGMQLAKSHKVKKKKTRKPKNTGHLSQPIGSETLDEDYTIPLNDRRDQFLRDNAAEPRWTSRESMVGRAAERSRTAAGKKVEDTATDHTSQTPCTPHSMKTSYFELDLAHGSTPMSLISMDEFDWLEDLYHEESHVRDNHAYAAASQARESDECEVVSAAMDHVEQIMNDNDANIPSTEMKRTLGSATTGGTKTPLSFAMAQNNGGTHNDVISAAVIHVEHITKKNSCISPQIKRTFQRTHTSLSSQKKSNSSEGGSISTTSNADGPSSGICTESYLESPEWKAREQLRKDWMHFIANHRPLQSRLNHHRSSSVPNMISAATRVVAPQMLSTKSTSLHATRSDIRSLSSSSTPPSSPPAPPLKDEALDITLESWEVEQRKAVLNRKIKDAKRHNTSRRQRRTSCTT
jgi:hypothetical protein